MESQTIHAIIQLMENGEVFHTIEMEDIDDYKFYFDSEELSTLSIIVSHLKMKDLTMLVTRPYESYILIGTKTTLKENRPYAIPAKAYKHMNIFDDGTRIILTFSQENKNEGN